MLLEPGSRLQDYQISGHLGSGGMGDVYRAKDLRLDREVAIKLLPRDLAEDADRLKRFEREAQALAKLNHTNVVQVYDVGRWVGQPFIVMEYLEGSTLRDAMAAGPIPARRAVELALQIVRGLSAAHEKGIVHRDLKPENIFLTRGGHIRLLDFGLAKPYTASIEFDLTAALPDPARALITKEGSLVGTLGYMAPEQVQGGPVDVRTDLFAFGIVLYEMTVGARPFSGHSTIETLHAILKLDPPEIPLDLRIPALLERVIRRCLEKDPEARFQSSRDLAFALEHLGSTSQAAVSAPAAELTTRLKRGQRLQWAAALLCVFGAGLGVARVLPRFEANRAGHLKTLTPLPLLLTNARYLPGGRGVVFSAINEDGVEELYSGTDQERPRALGIRNARLCSVSPTGELAVIVGDHLANGVGNLAIVPSGGGGAPREIAKDVGWAEWGPDGHSLAIKWWRYKGDPVQALEYPQGNLAYKVPYGRGMGPFTVSQTDGRIAFMETIGSDKKQLVLSSKGGNRFFRNADIPGIEDLNNLRWKDGALYGSSAPKQGRPAIVKIDLEGRALRPVEDSWFKAELLDLGSDGRFLIKGPNQASSVIKWKPASSPVEREVRWCLEPSLTSISSDGNALLFSEPRGSADLWLLKAGEAVPTLLGKGGYASRFSPDGQSVATLAPAPGSDYQILVHPIGAGASTTLPGIWITAALSFFPDGKSLFLWGALPRGSEQRGSYTQKLDGSPAQPIGDGQALTGPLSPDGQWCFIRESWNIFARTNLYNLNTKRIVPLRDWLPLGILTLSWTPDGKSFYWRPRSKGTGAVPEVHRYDLASGRDTLVFSRLPGGPNERINQILISGDGRSFVYQVVTEARTSLLEVSRQGKAQ